MICFEQRGSDTNLGSFFLYPYASCRVRKERIGSLGSSLLERSVSAALQKDGVKALEWVLRVFP